MSVAAHQVVSITYTLKDEKGEVLDSADEKQPFSFLYGANNIVPGLEKALDGKNVGDSVDVTLKPEDAYGFRDEKLVRNVPLRRLEGKGIVAGRRYSYSSEAGVQVALVTAVKGDYAQVDLNHPLAGMPLHFEVKVVALRDATEEEKTHGHVHGPHGHEH